jgi:hypothetical protein
MPHYLRVAIFTLAFALGVAATYPLRSWMRPDFAKSTLHFVYQPTHIHIGQRVHHVDPERHNHSRGRVAHVDGLFVAVRWEIAPDNGPKGLRWYATDAYEKLIVAEESQTCAF